MKNIEKKDFRKEFVNEYKAINKEKDNAIKKAFENLEDLTVISQALACDVTIDFFIENKLLTISELSKLIAKDNETISKVRNMFLSYHIEFKNKSVIDSFKRLQRHLASDTIEKLKKRKVQLT